MTRRRWLVVILLTAAVLLIAGRSVAGIYSDYLWYNSLGAIALWRTRFMALTMLRTGSALAAAVFTFMNLYAVRSSVVSLVFPRRIGNIEIGEEVPGRYLMASVVALSIVLGILLAVPQDDWTSVMLARTGRMFNESDPYFAADLGFFVYWLPFESSLWMWAFTCVVVVGIAVLLLYALTPSLKWQQGRLYASTYVRRHVTVLVGILLLLLAWSFRLDMYSLLVDGGGVDGTFSYVDHHIGVNGDFLLSFATLSAALIVIWAGSVGHFRLAGISVLTVIVVSLAVREIAPVVAEHSGSDAEHTLRERPYYATRAAYTRRAYAVDAIGRADASIAYPSLAAALPWIPAWDPPALSRVIDAGRSGEDIDVRIGWHAAAAGLVADVVDPPPPGASARAPWTVARILAASADEHGNPLRLVGGAATTSTATDDATLEAPLVYPGASRFTIIPDSLNHIAGTSLEPTLTRIASAWSLQNFRILSTEMPEPRPTIIAFRDVRDRVERLMPFFVQGRHVEAVLPGDSLYWVLHLYTASDMYPLSRHAMLAGDERSYLHHAAVAIVEAATGDISVVPDSVLDPIAATWVRRLPSIFGTWAALPSGIRNLISPPIDGVYAQAIAFGRYGSRTETDPVRHVPTLDGGDTSVTTDYVPMVLPGSQATAVTIPLVDDTDRLRGLIIGTGGVRSGTAWYPLPTPGPRWTAVLDRLRSVDSAGSTVREGPLAHGRVRAVAVRGGIAFVQPTYRWRPQAAPTLSRVATLSGDTARSVPPPLGPVDHTSPSTKPGSIQATPMALYHAMRDALRRGDWAAFGRAFEALGHALSTSPVRSR